MGFQANCPACGSLIEFNVANSVVTVCESCSSAVARNDGALENLGKVADLIQTDSPLELGHRGRFKGVPFEIVGRTQIQHSAGGLWDEWYVAFKGGARWGWLAEAQGRYYLTFDKKIPSNFRMPGPDELEIDDELTIPGLGGMVVTEVGEGEIRSAVGEMPYAAKPGFIYEFADLTGAGRKYATIDWSEAEPVLYAGGEVTLQQLELHDAASRAKEINRTTTRQVNCPKCAGPLELLAPDETLRVACPWCSSMLSCEHGDLKFLNALGKKPVEPILPLGSVGTIQPEWVESDWDGPREYTVMGFMQRKVTYEGVNYYWHEYLLYRPRTPFAWLTWSEGHWSFGEGVPAGDVSAGPRTAQYNGQTYRIYDRANPKVNWVQGEFYWKVEVGETVRSADYIKPPRMLSRETSQSEPGENRHEGSKRDKKNREINYTVLHYLQVDQVKQAFQVEELPVPRGVAPHQPFPYANVYKRWGLLAAIAFGLMVLISLTKSGRSVFVATETFQAGQYGPIEKSLSRPIRGGENIEISVNTTGPWAYVSGELLNSQTGKSVSFGVPSGKSVMLSPIDAGDYRVRYSGKWRTMSSNSPTITLRIKQDVFRFGRFIWVMVLLSIIPGCIMMYNISFSTRRWADSDYSPYNQS